ncbi:hypothetical protein ID866_5591, partial [Astraeus odoratus]
QDPQSRPNVSVRLRSTKNCTVWAGSTSLREYDFHGKLRKLYEKNRHLTDEAEIEKAIQFGEYIKNETLALYSLRKYRHLKRMYPSGSDGTGSDTKDSNSSSES